MKDNPNSHEGERREYLYDGYTTIIMRHEVTTGTDMTLIPFIIRGELKQVLPATRPY